MERNEEFVDKNAPPSEEVDEQTKHPMDALLEQESYELETPRRGEIRTGTIARISDNDILVDIGAKSEGVILSREIEQLSEDRRDELVVGSDVNVFVVRSADRDGTLLLSLSRAEEEKDWQHVEKLEETREAYEGTISGYNKGGLIVKLGHLRGFIPASQVSISRRRRAEGETPDKRWGNMVGEPIIAKIIEVDRRRNRLILSERAAAREARDALKERLISELQPGETRTGHVISLADFGAFVDIGGADGLVHVSEMSWKRLNHPSEKVKVGEEVEVKVLGVDPERKRISLSLRELEDNPWDQVIEQYQEGQLVEGTITKLTKFGAFAYLKGTEEYEIEGLIHISELSDRRIEHPKEVVQEEQTLTLRLIKIDQSRRRIGLSLRRVDSSEYAELDWQTAMQEAEPEAESEEVEDFDAALEAEAPDIGLVDDQEISEPEAAVEDEVTLEDQADEEEAPDISLVDDQEISEPEAAVEDEAALEDQADEEEAPDIDLVDDQEISEPEAAVEDEATLEDQADETEDPDIGLVDDQEISEPEAAVEDEATLEDQADETEAPDIGLVDDQEISEPEAAVEEETTLEDQADEEEAPDIEAEDEEGEPLDEPANEVDLPVSEVVEEEVDPDEIIEETPASEMSDDSLEGEATEVDAQEAQESSQEPESEIESVPEDETTEPTPEDMSETNGGSEDEE